MNKKKISMFISCVSVSLLTITSCASNQETKSLTLSQSCAKLDGIATKLAEGIGKAQDEPTKAKDHLNTSRDALKSLISINSSDQEFISVAADYSVKLNAFLDALEGAINNGSGLIDPTVTPSRDAARTAGEKLDAICK